MSWVPLQAVWSTATVLNKDRSKALQKGGSSLWKARETSAAPRAGSRAKGKRRRKHRLGGGQKKAGETAALDRLHRWQNPPGKQRSQQMTCRARTVTTAAATTTRRPAAVRRADTPEGGWQKGGWGRTCAGKNRQNLGSQKPWRKSDCWSVPTPVSPNPTSVHVSQLHFVITGVAQVTTSHKLQHFKVQKIHELLQ